MLRSLLTNKDIAIYPAIVSVVFFVFFLYMLYRVFRRENKEHYQQMSSLALDVQASHGENYGNR